MFEETVLLYLICINMLYVVVTCEIDLLGVKQ